MSSISVQPDTVPSPTEHLTALANEVASALEFMSGKFGPPALPHLAHLTASAAPHRTQKRLPGPFACPHAEQSTPEMLVGR